MARSVEVAYKLSKATPLNVFGASAATWGNGGSYGRWYDAKAREVEGAARKRMAAEVEVRTGIQELAQAATDVAARVGHDAPPWRMYDALVVATAAWVSVVAPRSRL